MAVGLACIAGLAATAASAQPLPRIWDIAMGTHVRDLPAQEFVDPACGTNGGPPSRFIGTFAAFEECPPEASGLREIAFTYDDLAEYVALAHQDRGAVDRNRATTVLAQPVFLSLLFDADGRVQGYRVFTDPRAEADRRLLAYGVATHFRARLGDGWACTDLPREEGESPIEGTYVKQRCEIDTGGVHATVESHHYYKPGQHLLNPFDQRPMENEFESSARLEVVQVDPLPPRAQVAAVEQEQQVFLDPREAFLAGQTPDCPGCNLVDADLRRRNLTNANLSGANLERAVLHRAVLRDANLDGANLLGANLNKADLTRASLRNADLTTAMLYEADAARANFSGADLIHTYMGRARLSLADMSGTTLVLAQMQETRMNDVNFSGATMHGASLLKAVLFRANLSGVLAEEIDLTEASMRGANLRGAKILNGKLLLADLSGSDLSNADFTSSYFLSANLYETNQTGTIFTGATMPDNSIHP